MSAPKTKIIFVKKPSSSTRQLAKSHVAKKQSSNSGRLGTTDAMSFGMDGKDIMPVSTKARTPIKPPKK